LPDLPVAIDSRIELFPASVWTDYGIVLAGADGWKAVLDRWGVTIVVVEPGRSEFVERLVGAGWRSAYSGPDGTVVWRDGS
jgi:hypothetical protein